MRLCGCYANEALKQGGRLVISTNRLVISTNRQLLPLGQPILDAESMSTAQGSWPQGRARGSNSTYTVPETILFDNIGGRI